jgi:hypothetical protein
VNSKQAYVDADRPGTCPPTGYDKSLLDLPWRYALACMDELGLILRSEIIWEKVNGLPESVTDRVRRSHEQIFHFTLQPKYYAAVDEIREAHSGGAHDQGPNATVQVSESGNGVKHRTFRSRTDDFNPLGKLPGSVWEIPSFPLKAPAHLGIDHFAAYPPELVRRIVLGWSPPGICTACGEGRRPVAVADAADIKPFALSQRGGRSWHGDGDSPTRALGTPAADRNRRITGYACACPDNSAPARPSLVVDPFGGTGTTALVASAYGRDAVTIDMSADYCRLAEWRTADQGERARVLHQPKPVPVAPGDRSLF